jgi:hypothetical protein
MFARSWVWRLISFLSVHFSSAWAWWDAGHMQMAYVALQAPRRLGKGQGRRSAETERGLPEVDRRPLGVARMPVPGEDW